MTIEEYKDIIISMLGDSRTECKAERKGVKCSDCPLLGQCIQKTQQKAQRLIYTKPLKKSNTGLKNIQL